jgi:hypothetical protein
VSASTLKYGSSYLITHITSRRVRRRPAFPLPLAQGDMRSDCWVSRRYTTRDAVFYIYQDYPGILIVLIIFWSGMG